MDLNTKGIANNVCLLFDTCLLMPLSLKEETKQIRFKFSISPNTTWCYLSLYLPISKWHLLDMGEYYHTNTLTQMRGSASNVCISLESKLHYLTLERTVGRVTGCFLRGCMPTCVVWKTRRGGQTVGCCWCIWMCAMKSLLRVLHCLISLSAKQHHTLFASPSLHFLRDTWYIWWVFVHLTSLPVCTFWSVCMCVCLIQG